MRKMILETLTKVNEKFKEKIKDTCLCELKTIRFDRGNSPDYNKDIIQLLYLLRYYPAYLCEYKYIYQNIITKNIFNNLHILSIGCGCCVDYHGAFLANQRNYSNIAYTGIDITDWDFADSFGNSNFIRLFEDIKSIILPEENNYNIVIFPKSISEFDDESFNTFLSNLSITKFTQDKIILISSSMDIGYQFDEQRYKIVLQQFESFGFKPDKYMPPQEIAQKGGLNRLDSQFDYPNNIKDDISYLSTECKKFIETGENCEIECLNQLNKSPILRTNYISFQINILKR